MRLLYDYFQSRRNEIDLLRQENRLIRDTVIPLTSLGIPFEKLPEVMESLVKIFETNKDVDDSISSDSFSDNHSNKKFYFDRKMRKLRKENRILRDIVSPFTSIGISLEVLKEILTQVALILKEEINKKRHEASFRSSGGAVSSPVSIPNDLGYSNFRIR
jgi:hypothetical protein